MPSSDLCGHCTHTHGAHTWRTHGAHTWHTHMVHTHACRHIHIHKQDIQATKEVNRVDFIQSESIQHLGGPYPCDPNTLEAKAPRPACLSKAQSSSNNSLKVQERHRVWPAPGENRNMAYMAYSGQAQAGRRSGRQGQAHLNMAMRRLTSRMLATSKKTTRSNTTSQLAY